MISLIIVHFVVMSRYKNRIWLLRLFNFWSRVLAHYFFRSTFLHRVNENQVNYFFLGWEMILKNLTILVLLWNLSIFLLWLEDFLLRLTLYLVTDQHFLGTMRNSTFFWPSENCFFFFGGDLRIEFGELAETKGLFCASGKEDKVGIKLTRCEFTLRWIFLPFFFGGRSVSMSRTVNSPDRIRKTKAS